MKGPEQIFNEAINKESDPNKQVVIGRIKDALESIGYMLAIQSKEHSMDDLKSLEKDIYEVVRRHGIDIKMHAPE